MLYYSSSSNRHTPTTGKKKQKKNKSQLPFFFTHSLTPLATHPSKLHQYVKVKVKVKASKVD